MLIIILTCDWIFCNRLYLLSVLFLLNIVRHMVSDLSGTLMLMYLCLLSLSSTYISYSIVAVCTNYSGKDQSYRNMSKLGLASKVNNSQYHDFTAYDIT
jgi:hypothetical protein